MFESILICEGGVVIQMHQELGRRPADFQRSTVTSETRGVGLVCVYRSWVGLCNFIIEQNPEIMKEDIGCLPESITKHSNCVGTSCLLSNLQTRALIFHGLPSLELLASPYVLKL